MSKHQDLQKVLLGEIVFVNNFHKIKKIHDDVKDDDDFKNGKTYKIYKDINDVTYIGATYNILKKCLSKFKKESKTKIIWINNKFYDIMYLNKG